MTSSLAQPVVWQRSRDAEFPYETVVAGERWRVRINDFPVDETKYTLFVEAEARLGFNDWPKAWVRPAKS